MFYEKINKKIVFLIVCIFFIIGVWLVLDFVKIGPGLPPPETMPKWYIPGAWQGNTEKCTLPFPEISPYCKFGKYPGGRFINVWYFDDESKFWHCYPNIANSLFLYFIKRRTEYFSISILFV